MSPSQRAICGEGDTAHPGDARWGHPPGPPFVHLFVHLFCNQLEQLGISSWGHTNSAGRFRGRLVATSSGDTPQSGDARWGHPPGPSFVHQFVHEIDGRLRTWQVGDTPRWSVSTGPVVDRATQHYYTLLVVTIPWGHPLFIILLLSTKTNITVSYV